MFFWMFVEEDDDDCFFLSLSAEFLFSLSLQNFFSLFLSKLFFKDGNGGRGWFLASLNLFSNFSRSPLSHNVLVMG